MKLSRNHFLVAAMTCFVVACADSPTNPRRGLDPSTAPNDAKANSNAGTTLSATKTATGFYESRVDYNWTLSKHVKTIMDEKFGLGMYALPSTSEVEIPKGEVRWI